MSDFLIEKSDIELWYTSRRQNEYNRKQISISDERKRWNFSMPDLPHWRWRGENKSYNICQNQSYISSKVEIYLRFSSFLRCETVYLAQAKEYVNMTNSVYHRAILNKWIGFVFFLCECFLLRSFNIARWKLEMAFSKLYWRFKDKLEMW